jgi:hypothetical protein
MLWSVIAFQFYSWKPCIVVCSFLQGPGDDFERILAAEGLMLFEPRVLANDLLGVTRLQVNAPYRMNLECFLVLWLTRLYCEVNVSLQIEQGYCSSVETSGEDSRLKSSTSIFPKFKPAPIISACSVPESEGGSMPISRTSCA